MIGVITRVTYMVMIMIGVITRATYAVKSMSGHCQMPGCTAATVAHCAIHDRVFHIRNWCDVE